MARTTSTEQHAQLPLVESPALTFRRYAVAFHLAAEWRGDDGPRLRGENVWERALESYEDDMLLYAHRDDPPFRTRVVRAAHEAVTVRFPPVIAFETEGRRKHVRCFGATGEGRFRTFTLRLGQTWFERSRLAVLTFILTPNVDSDLNEYDVLKLVKLWEGGEAVADEPSINEGKDVWFANDTLNRATLEDLAAQHFPGWKPLRYEQQEQSELAAAPLTYRVGTLALELSAVDVPAAVFEDLAALKCNRQAPADSARRARAVAVAGILQGLLDFRAIDDDELADVFADADVDADREALRAFHKGTLLSVSAEADDSDERPSPVGIDPYLVIPNVVLLHNEQRLKAARLREHTLSHRQRGPFREWRGRAPIGDTENGLGEMAGLLAQHLPNVFHYASERHLQERGHHSRGLDDLETYMRLRMDDLASVLQWRVRRRDRWTAVIGIAVGAITAFLVKQAIEGSPLWAVVIAGLALFSVFLWLRDRLFLGPAAQHAASGESREPVPRAQRGQPMAHHYSGPDFSFPHGDPRVDHTDLFAFPAPEGSARTVLIIDVHPSVGINPPGPTTRSLSPEAVTS